VRGGRLPLTLERRDRTCHGQRARSAAPGKAPVGHGVREPRAHGRRSGLRRARRSSLQHLARGDYARTHGRAGLARGFAKQRARLRRRYFDEEIEAVEQGAREAREVLVLLVRGARTAALQVTKEAARTGPRCQCAIWRFGPGGQSRNRGSTHEIRSASGNG